ncbi:ubiquitin carboxyl-terminal hydrolase 8 isoform X1 [Drosophila novamexicana]|uniref:ubiquitin carboxyl-terminal hydrolase 8 isoform X1 n=1 Tax=Drosophila novamexicana TaxID=47314 RepID=UPI0011E58FAC|nr:ubiquitin carboxyl-terminal hydrolase 8 isoform X1 [Drosophila novamexicana]
MAQWKKLYMGDRIEDLEKWTTIPDLRNKSMKILLNTARKLYLTAEDYRLDGDQELAYITYMKYFNMLSAIRGKSDYNQHKLTVRQVLGDTDSNRRIMDTLELINTSLRKRYEQLLPPGGGNAKTNGAPISPPLPSVEPIDEKGSLASAAAFAQLGVITCEALFRRMQQKSVLVMDCRNSADYNNSHLTYYCAFNVPEELITPGMSAGKLQACLSSSAKASWAARSVKESVVLMDWNSKDAHPTGNAAIYTLLDILKNWDPDVTYRTPIQILEGGYEYFIMMYPTHCTNPSVQAPQQNNNDIETIDDIEYPSINDITMKEDVMNEPNTKHKQRPSINRASKPAALRTYEQSQQNQQPPEPQENPINEIIRDQETLLLRAQHNDMLLDSASKKWQSIFELKQLQAEGAVLSTAEQEVLYNIMQLESKADDYKMENNRLRDELNRYKEQTPQNHLQNDTETTKRIESKIQERQELDKQHERDRLERERQLAIAREAKRHYKPPAEPTSTRPDTPTDDSPPNSNSELQHTVTYDEAPPRPVYDRSTKPQSRDVETTAPRVRDFSPVVGHNVGRGLTGLKNLGNTCYMNSILQCLSNTPQLMEFCISDKYKNYISRRNKTNGQVIEEVAALIKELWNGQYKCVASRDLRYVVGQYQKIFRGVDQQDSHEFLTILMDWLHSDLQTLRVPRKRDIISAAEKAWLEFTKSQESIIQHLFYGQIKSTVKCVTCTKESATYECFSNLSLELPANANFCYLHQCMDMYFSGEKIHGWNCPNCKTKRDAIKKLDISKLPPVLVVHLKRFYADPSNAGAYIKKQNYLQFPLENLEMKPYTARVESRAVTPKTYQLYAVSNHYGTMEGGHYTAFCKSAHYGRWYKFDDQVVSPLDTSNVVSSAAYILFYSWLPPMQLSIS